MEIHARVINNDGKKLVLSVARDISEAKKAREALKCSEKKLRAYVENSPIAFMVGRSGKT